MCGLVTARAAGDLRGAIGHRYVVTVPAGIGDVDGLAARLRSSPAVRAVEPVSEEERLMILQMLQDGKITVEQAEMLLAAMEGRG